ncbi:bZIP transcription factor 46-like [Andrographis paniculata]|uniref:bZIP transcription factor 46-like n=1 Tax=Andrographis paniculata TaxID=175694 RepID=UPI0021E816FE|nr:bZIP transcription factor 46-like [Andrographis paniculata]XP_051149983.1 bZIP transcription factor 46-like [Andrographis paniculata]XP_051149984.1 bZIP transcription factor 46-like [Andrographis paniculata]
MGSNLNFKNLGTGDMAAGGGRPPGNFPLTRQSSIYSLTFDEFQTAVGGTGKDFVSMNMDELLKNIWTAEENQTAGSTSGGGGAAAGVGNSSLQRQGSLTLPRTLSQKTVDEVWKNISKDYGASAAADFGGFNIPVKEPTLGEVTLEEFLVRAGVVREDPQLAKVSYFGDLSNVMNSSAMGGFGIPHAPPSPPLLPKPNLAFRPSAAVGMSDLPINGGAVPSAVPLQGIVGLGTNGVTAVRTGSPAVSSEGVNKSNGGDTSSVSPIPYAFNGGFRGRRSTALEKVVERRQRRMIKNRESAARSRARKQAYTMELEAEVAKLKEENEELQRKHARLVEIQKNRVAEMANAQQNGNKRQCLRRTQTCRW